MNLITKKKHKRVFEEYKKVIWLDYDVDYMHLSKLRTVYFISNEMKFSVYKQKSSP